MTSEDEPDPVGAQTLSLLTNRQHIFLTFIGLLIEFLGMRALVANRNDGIRTLAATLPGVSFIGLGILGR